nr:NUDIX domain-containing protein [Jannaschia sp. S6380]
MFGTLVWDSLLADVAGRAVDIVPATLSGWRVERAAAGDWPVLVEGGRCEGGLTGDLPEDAKARLDWYETAFGYVPDAVQVAGPDGPVAALVYREAAPSGGSGEAWSLDDWIARHGERTRLAAAEVMRGHGRVAPQGIAARRGVIHARAQGIVTARRTRRPATVGGEHDATEVAVHRVDYPYEGFHRVEEWHLDHPRFDGTRSERMQRAISHVTDAATVLPWDPARDRVLVVEQIRIGALAKGDPLPWMLEPVAGLIDAGETPTTTALREMEEEAGLTVAPDALHFVGRYYPSPGGLAQVINSYVALCDLPNGSDGLHGLDEEHEDIRAHLVPRADLMAMVASGEAANAPLIVSALWLAHHAERLRG